jgi:hypothetical protein
MVSGWAAAAAVHSAGSGHLPGELVFLLTVAAAVLAARVGGWVARTAQLDSYTLMSPDTLAVSAAVVAGTAAAWAGRTVGFEVIPTVLVGLIVGATVRGTYRRHARTQH